MWQFWCWEEYIDTGEISTDVYIYKLQMGLVDIYIYSIQSKSIYVCCQVCIFYHIITMVKLHFYVLFVWGTDIT